MDVGTFIFLGIALALIGYSITLYNNLVALNHNVDKA